MSDQTPRLYGGHIDPDCEVVRGVGAFCTCETPHEKAERQREQAENEAESDRPSPMREQTPEALAAIIEQAMEAESLRAAVETLTARVESADSHIELLESKNENIRTFWMGQWRLFRQQVVACLPFLKDGETPAMCIERWRNDGLVVMKLLADEKLRCEALERVLAQLRDDAMVMDVAYPVIASVLSGEEIDTAIVEEQTPGPTEDDINRLEKAAWDSNTDRVLVWYRDQVQHVRNRMREADDAAKLDRRRAIAAESRCEALTAERDKAESRTEDAVRWIDQLREELAAAKETIANRDSRCQHLEQAVKAIAERCRRDCDKLHRSGSHDIALENTAIAGELEAALASILPAEETPRTDENRVSFAAGYTAALDDALKGKSHD